MIGQCGELVAELFHGRGDGGFFGKIQVDAVGAGAVFEEGEETNVNTHEAVC